MKAKLINNKQLNLTFLPKTDGFGDIWKIVRNKFVKMGLKCRSKVDLPVG